MATKARVSGRLRDESRRPLVVTDWWAVIFNPLLPYRPVGMALAAHLTTAFVPATALHLLRDRCQAAARVLLSMAA